MSAANECNVDLFASMQAEFAEQEGPYWIMAAACGITMVVVFVVAHITNNYSQVDKLWSLLPFLYSWTAVSDSRTLCMAVVASIWGTRLTYNFARRGGYTWPPWQGEEDYRWKYVREGGLVSYLSTNNHILWFLFSIGFISIYQNLLLALLAAPSLVAYTVAKECPVGWNVLDSLATLLVIFFVVIETMADDEQYAFQSKKYELKEKGLDLPGEYGDGFKQSGLFAIVRKPNYAAEQMVWVSYYLYSVAATSKWWNWSAIGWINLVLLFQMSGRFTERITIAKYPAYSRYQTQVPLYVPSVFGRKSVKED